MVVAVGGLWGAYRTCVKDALHTQTSSPFLPANCQLVHPLLRLVRSSWQNGHHFETESTATEHCRAARVPRSPVAAATPGASDDHWIGGRIQTVRGHRAV